MKKTILIILICSLILSCSKYYVQVFETNSLNINTIDDFYVYETDTLKITYNFWSSKGLITFAIFNKLDKPIYIDWKKSAYIDNAVKLDYWIDEQIVNSYEYYGSYYYRGTVLSPKTSVSISSGHSMSTSSTVKQERITFIPPKSNYFRSQFYILPYPFYKLGKNDEQKVVPRNDNPKRKTTIYSKSFSKETTPRVFRNFLTFSLTENFDNEFYIDNAFYITNIKQMDKRHFAYNKYDEARIGKFYVRDKYGNPIILTPFKKETSFYYPLFTTP